MPGISDNMSDADTLAEWPPNTRLIWKFELRPWSIFIDVPKGAKLLSAGAQGDSVVVWMLCNPNEQKVQRMIAAHPTGVPIPPALSAADFFATVQMDDGLVFHVFAEDGHNAY